MLFRITKYLLFLETYLRSKAHEVMLTLQFTVVYRVKMDMTY